MVASGWLLLVLPTRYRGAPKPAVIYARAIYYAGFVLILFSLAAVMASFIECFIVKNVLEL
jgi:hypothetical protein